MKSPSQTGPGLSWTISCEHLVTHAAHSAEALSAKLMKAQPPLQLHIDEACFSPLPRLGETGYGLNCNYREIEK